ncbi:MAG: hypothetical protein ABIP94_09470 [Planctomycetota bacterium]
MQTETDRRPLAQSLDRDVLHDVLGIVDAHEPPRERAQRMRVGQQLPFEIGHVSPYSPPTLAADACRAQKSGAGRDQDAGTRPIIAPRRVLVAAR